MTAECATFRESTSPQSPVTPTRLSGNRASSEAFLRLFLDIYLDVHIKKDMCTIQLLHYKLPSSTEDCHVLSKALFTKQQNVRSYSECYSDD